MNIILKHFLNLVTEKIKSAVDPNYILHPQNKFEASPNFTGKFIMMKFSITVFGLTN